MAWCQGDVKIHEQQQLLQALGDVRIRDHVTSEFTPKARAWTQRYEHGLPVTDLVSVDDDHASGTTVHFLPGEELRAAAAAVTAAELRQLIAWPHLSVEVIDQRNR